MTADDTPGGGEPLQFDRVETGQQDPRDGPDQQPLVTCKACDGVIRTHYFALGSAPLCESCKVSLEKSVEAARRWQTFMRAVVYGLGASIAGAILYYAVLAITNLEIGLVAIAIGYMVGYAVRKSTRGFGGRRFQVLALCLTYFSVGLAYFPLVIKQSASGKPTPAVSASDSRAAAPAPTTAEAAPSSEPRPPITFGRWLQAIGMLFLVCLALPALAVVTSLPSGLISAVIIGVGMRQAWRMTGAPPIEVTGPYRLGSELSAT
jgi:hypothetical protein